MKTSGGIKSLVRIAAVGMTLYTSETRHRLHRGDFHDPQGESDLARSMRLNLPIIDRRSVSGVHGAGAVNVHLAHVHIPSLALTLYGPFCAVDLVAGGQAHHALIGRTFLQGFTMIYEGRTGNVVLHNE